MDKLNEYHKRLVETHDGDIRKIATELAKDCFDQKEECYDTLEESGLRGDKPLEIEDFDTAAKYVIKEVEKEVSND